MKEKKLKNTRFVNILQNTTCSLVCVIQANFINTIFFPLNLNIKLVWSKKAGRLSRTQQKILVGCQHRRLGISHKRKEAKKQHCSILDQYWLTAVSAARWIVELLQWKMVFKSPFLIWKLWNADIWTEYS